ncbi:MAG: hypothetical protein IPM24_05930 [Bryobacterales bacterium]|nr:hypothetical protein [Bryobacterales bacterium]
MNPWLDTPDVPPFSGPAGELVSVTVSADPWDLEALLDALALLPFPVNPELHHPSGDDDSALTRVSFPAYSRDLTAVREVLLRTGQDPGNVAVSAILDR